MIDLSMRISTVYNREKLEFLKMTDWLNVWYKDIGNNCCYCCLVAKLCPSHGIHWDPMDCSLTGTSVHGISQARILEWVAISFSKGSSQARDQIQISYIAGGFFIIWATREAPYIHIYILFIFFSIMVCHRILNIVLCVL